MMERVQRGLRMYEWYESANALEMRIRRVYAIRKFVIR